MLNGVSFNCVQCHSHPYDPIRHNEYYKFLAFFNTSKDADIAFDSALADDWPILRVPTDKADYAEADRLQRESEALQGSLVNINIKLDRLVQFRIHGVDEDLIRRARAHGFNDLSADDLVDLAIHGRRWLRG